uniref:Peptidase S1 domain-containing protein n=1 Tax=Lates calcarifer TaxID=8187 RepID=A0A4W6C4Y0_LATCA
MQPPIHTGQIYGGHEAVAHSRPYMVLLERHMQNGETYYCDGFLLTEDFVMTAAHCQAKSLSSKANFSNNVRPIALADRDDGSLPKSCSVSGWGRNNRSSKYMSLTLMEVNVTLIDNELNHCTLCMHFQGDSGGPLVCEDGKAYGVVSSSHKTNPDGLYVYSYTKIPKNTDWRYR